MSLLASDKTNIKELRAIINALISKYPLPGSYIPLSGGLKVIANNERGSGCNITLDCFQGFYSLTVCEFLRNPYKVTRDERHNIVRLNERKLKTMLQDAYREINQ